jgi:WD40 repeat protein
MIASLRPDAPWTPARNRLTLLISLTIAGIIAGAFHGFLLGLTRTGGGDARVWEPIELGAQFGVVPGLATGLAVILSRRWWCRMAMAALFGTGLYLMLALLYGDTLLPIRLKEWQDALNHPMGPALLQMAPMSSCLALSVHLFRTCSTSLRSVAVCWALSVIIGLQSQCLFWFAVRASVYKNPFDDFMETVVSRDSMGGLVFAMVVGLVTLAVELASLHARFPRRLTVAVGALGVATVAGLYGLCQAMPLTPPSDIVALAFAPDGRTLVTAHSGDTLRVWRVDGEYEPAAREIRKTRLARLQVEYLTCVTNGSQVLVTGRKETISVYDAMTLDLSAEVRYAGCRFRTSALSHNGAAIAVVDQETQDLWLWQGGGPSHPFGVSPLILWSGGHAVQSLQFTADERFLVGLVDWSRFLVWEVSTGELLWDDVRPEEIQSRNPASSSHPTAVVIDAYRRQIDPVLLWIEEGGWRALKFEPGTLCVDYGPDGRQHACTDGVRLSFTDLIAGETVIWRLLLEDGERVRVLAYSPDGEWIATGISDGRVQIFRAPAFDAD